MNLESVCSSNIVDNFEFGIIKRECSKICVKFDPKQLKQSSRTTQRHPELVSGSYEVLMRSRNKFGMTTVYVRL